MKANPRFAPILTPLHTSHADALFDALSDPEIYCHLHIPPPPNVHGLRRRFAELTKLQASDGKIRYLSWVVAPAGMPPIGYMVAVIEARGEAWITIVLGRQYWGRGHGTAAVEALEQQLCTEYGVTRFLMLAEGDDHRTIHLLQRLGFRLATASEVERPVCSKTEHLFLRRLAPPRLSLY